MNQGIKLGAEIEKPHLRIEDDLRMEKKRKFFQELRELFSEGNIDTHSVKFTELVLKHAIGTQRYNDLTSEEKGRWHKRVNRIIIDKLGGHAEAGWKVELQENLKKKKENEKNEPRIIEELREDESTIKDLISDLESYNFTSD